MSSLLDTEFCSRSLCSWERLCIWLCEGRTVILVPVYLKQFVCPNNHWFLCCQEAGGATFAVLCSLNRRMDHSTCKSLSVVGSWILSKHLSWTQHIIDLDSASRDFCFCQLHGSYSVVLLRISTQPNRNWFLSGHAFLSLILEISLA